MAVTAAINPLPILLRELAENRKLGARLTTGDHVVARTGVSTMSPQFGLTRDESRSQQRT